jgi:hypothetical protein
MQNCSRAILAFAICDGPPAFLEAFCVNTNPSISSVSSTVPPTFLTICAPAAPPQRRRHIHPPARVVSRAGAVALASGLPGDKAHPDVTKVDVGGCCGIDDLQHGVDGDRRKKVRILRDNLRTRRQRGHGG